MGNRFTWTEIFADESSLLEHFDNPPVIEAMGPVTDKLYGGNLDIHIYGETSDQLKANVAQRGVEITYHDRVLG